VNVLARVEFKTAREIAKLATDLYADGKSIPSTSFSASSKCYGTEPDGGEAAAVEAIGEEKGSKEKPDSGKTAEAQVDYIYEQPEAELLNKLLPRYIETQILRAMLESSASEYAARMTAMESQPKTLGMSLRH